MTDLVLKLRRRVPKATPAGFCDSPRFGEWGNAFDFLRNWLFSEQYYRRFCGPDLKSATRDVLWAHFLAVGQWGDASPSPFFDVQFARRFMQVRGLPSDLSIVEYWSTDEGVRLPVNALLDPVYYFMRNRDVRYSGLDPLVHWTVWGLFEGRQPSSFFQPNSRASKHESLKERLASIQGTQSLESFVEENAGACAVNVLALRRVYGDLDLLNRVSFGDVSSCTDPQVLLGDLIDSREAVLKFLERRLREHGGTRH